MGVATEWGYIGNRSRTGVDGGDKLENLLYYSGLTLTKLVGEADRENE